MLRWSHSSISSRDTGCGTLILRPLRGKVQHTGLPWFVDSQTGQGSPEISLEPEEKELLTSCEIEKARLFLRDGSDCSFQGKRKGFQKDWSNIFIAKVMFHMLYTN